MITKIGYKSELRQASHDTARSLLVLVFLALVEIINNRTMNLTNINIGVVYSR